MSLQPNSKFCFACGLANEFGLKMKFHNSGPGEVTAEYLVQEQYQGYPGVVHGGVVAAMLDEVTARTHLGGENPRFMYTARLNIRYRKNVPVGKPLRLVGKIGKSKRKAATATGEIYGPNGDLLAQAEALLIDIPEEVIESVDIEALGWKVYEETVENPA